MPVLKRLTPCAECPWLRKSIPGYLGADTPVHFYTMSVVCENTPETAMPCHMAIDYDEEDWLVTQYPTADICAGNLIHFRNWMKMPRDKGMGAAVRAVRNSPHVLASPQEFLAHHTDASADALEKLVEQALWGTTVREGDPESPAERRVT